MVRFFFAKVIFLNLWHPVSHFIICGYSSIAPRAMGIISWADNGKEFPISKPNAVINFKLLVKYGFTLRKVWLAFIRS